MDDPEAFVNNPDSQQAVAAGIAKEAGVDANDVDVTLLVGQCAPPPPPARRLQGSLSGPVQGPRHLQEGSACAEYTIKVKRAQSATVKAKLLGEQDLSEADVDSTLADTNGDGVVSDEEYNAFIENRGKMALAGSVNEELAKAGITSTVAVTSFDATIGETAGPAAQPPSGGEEVRTAGATVIVIVVLVVLLVIAGALFAIWRFRKSQQKPKEYNNQGDNQQETPAEQPAEVAEARPAPVETNQRQPEPVPAPAPAPEPISDNVSEPSVLSGA
jgi:hypothetical protein